MFDEDEHILRKIYLLQRFTNIETESIDSSLLHERQPKVSEHSEFRDLQFDYNFMNNTDPFLWSNEQPPFSATKVGSLVNFPVSPPSIPKSNTKKSTKLYYCAIKGCNKKYTSSFGLKYHAKKGHSEERMNVYKPYVCKITSCGRRYKNNNGLKYHMKHFHQDDIS